jgi:mannosyltransferase
MGTSEHDVVGTADPPTAGPAPAGRGGEPDPGTADAAERVPVERVPVEVVVVALVAVVAGIVLRFVTSSPLWLDEALSVNIAELPLGDIPDALRRDGHPPLYYVLLHGWIGLFGSGDLAVRALSGIVAVLTLPLAYVAGCRRGGRLLGWLALTMLAASPYAIRYATETRMYSIVILLVFVGYLLVDDLVRLDRGGWWRWAGVVLVTAALLYSHYWAMWLIAAVGLLLGWEAWKGDPGIRRPAFGAIAALVAGGVLFVPWLPVMLEQAAHTGTPWASPARPTVAVVSVLADLAGGGIRDADFFGTVLLALMLLAVFGWGIDRWRVGVDLRTRPGFRPEGLVVVLALGLGLAAAFVASSTFATRYAAVFFPLTVLLVAGGFTRFLDRWVRFGATMVVLIGFVVGIVFISTDQRSQARDNAAAITAVAEPGDTVVFCPDQLGPSGSRELGGEDLQLLAYPTLESPERVDWYDYEERNEAADPAAIAVEIDDRAGDGQVFVVWNGEYRTFEDQCEELVATLGALRPGGRVEVEFGGGEYFEPSALVVFPPAA